MKDTLRPTPDFTYQCIVDPTQREVLMRRGLDLVRYAHDKDIDMMIFLDKTARPLHQFMITLWPEIFPGQKHPAVKFVNLGTEKTELLRKFHYEILHVTPKVYSPSLNLHDQKELPAIYGLESINRLKAVLHSPTPQRRLVVDEISVSGRTIDLANTIFTLIDPKHSYKYFIFIDSFCRLPFGGNSWQAAFVPWHSESTLVYNYPMIDNSFESLPEKRQAHIDSGLQVRRELRQIAKDALQLR